MTDSVAAAYLAMVNSQGGVCGRLVTANIRP